MSGTLCVFFAVYFFFAAQGLQGLQAFFAPQGLQPFFAAQGLLGLHPFFAAQGLQALLFLAAPQAARALGRVAVAVMAAMATEPRMVLIFAVGFFIDWASKSGLLSSCICHLTTSMAQIQSNAITSA
ncbi:MAG: hypothetical protein O2967_08260 [Proteobacteria bacterium]|nr:hypothetical protein [Pseudomonadota bacterium]